jgi:hypothetical protein
MFAKDLTLFDRLTRVLIAVLPFHVLFSVFFGFKLGIPGVSLYKEALLFALALALGYDFFRRRSWPKTDWLDWLIAAYAGVLLVVSAFSGTSLAGIVAGVRYDLEFLFVFVLFKHGTHLLGGKFSDYVRIFVISSSIAILLGAFVRFVTKETILLHFGFSANLSNWQFGGSVPIYHGIPNANIRRFQGIFDGPNSAAYFLILHIGLILYYFRTKREYWGILALWLFGVFGLLLLTYTRSALVGVALATGFTVLLCLPVILRRYKLAFFSFVAVCALVIGGFYLRYSDSLQTIFLREGSSKGHFERMTMGIDQFLEHPMGSGLASSGPASRYTYDASVLSPSELKRKEDETIPESWYIQVLVEGGFLALALFLAIMATIAYETFRFHPFIAWSFFCVLGMNFFLHTFETFFVTLLLFLFLGIIAGYRREHAAR